MFCLEFPGFGKAKRTQNLSISSRVFQKSMSPIPLFVFFLEQPNLDSSKMCIVCPRDIALKHCWLGSVHAMSSGLRLLGHDPSQILMRFFRLFQVKVIYEIRLFRKFQHKLITYSKVMAPQSCHGKLKIDKTRGVRQLKHIFESQ